MRKCFGKNGGFFEVPCCYDTAGAQSASATTHRFAGEPVDPVTGFIHLRARDYDPSVGRFVSMDEHPGTQRVPLTLNKYLYANADPVNHVDPSGYMFAASLGAGMRVSTTLASVAAVSYAHIVRQIAFAGGRAIMMSNGQKLVSAAAHQGTFAIARALAKACLGVGQTLNKDCRAGMNMFIPGDTTKEHRQLVTDAIMGGAPFSLNYRKMSDKESDRNRRWLIRERNCKGRRSDNTDCDEYPFNSTYQGGEANRAMVWTRLITGVGDNRLAGSILQGMYSSCRMNDRDQFFVLPLIGVPTMYVCK